MALKRRIRNEPTRAATAAAAVPNLTQQERTRRMIFFTKRNTKIDQERSSRRNATTRLLQLVGKRCDRVAEDPNEGEGNPNQTSEKMAWPWSCTHSDDYCCNRVASGLSGTLCSFVVPHYVVVVPFFDERQRNTAARSNDCLRWGVT